jgi:hypothetical protein
MTWLKNKQIESQKWNFSVQASLTTSKIKIDSWKNQFLNVYSIAFLIVFMMSKIYT